MFQMNVIKRKFSLMFFRFMRIIIILIIIFYKFYYFPTCCAIVLTLIFSVNELNYLTLAIDESEGDKGLNNHAI